MTHQSKIENRKSKILWLALLLLALLPLITLVHKSDLARWDLNRSLMAAPDEFSYMLTAQNILDGKGISTQKTLGLDTFYPPGYPLLLAAWAALFGLTPFAAHLLNALLVSAATLVVYFFSKRLLTLLQDVEPVRHSSFVIRHFPALLIAALFATNWTVLESALYVFSEPAFMLVTFAWLALTLKWPHWHDRPPQTLAVALLAIAAWSLRGAGIICLAVTLLYPAASLMRQFWIVHLRKVTLSPGHLVTSSFPRLLTCLSLILALALTYQLALFHYSPEKSLFFASPSTNSYPRQLLGGITLRGELGFSHPADWPKIAARVGNLAASHLDDFAESLTPWLRDPPDFLPRYLVGKILALLALAGFLRSLLQSKMGGGENQSKIKNGGGRKSKIPSLLHLYLLFYFALYLLWPFNMPRFWSPILPIMLVFAIDAIRHFSLPRPSPHSPFTIHHSLFSPALLLALLLVLNVEELFLHLGDYQRRINDVSDALAASAATVVRLSPDPKETTVVVAGDDEHFIFAWYFHQLPAGADFLPQSPQAPPGHPNAPRESLESLLTRRLEQLANNPDRKLFVISYFTDPNYPEIFEKLGQIAPGLLHRFPPHRVFQRGGDITTVWEFQHPPKPQTSPAEK